MRPVRRSERVVDIDIAQRGELFRKAWIVLLLLGMKAQVLEQQHFARGRPHLFHLWPHAIRRHFHGTPEQLRQPNRHRLEAHLRIRLALGAAQVACQNHTRAMVERVLNGGERRPHPFVAGNLLPPRRQRDIKVRTDENRFALEIQISNRNFRHIT